jgi:hypothetical protein
VPLLSKWFHSNPKINYLKMKRFYFLHFKSLKPCNRWHMDISIHNNLRHISLLSWAVYKIFPIHFLIFYVNTIVLSHFTLETNSPADAMFGDQLTWYFHWSIQANEKYCLKRLVTSSVYLIHDSSSFISHIMLNELSSW